MKSEMITLNDLLVRNFKDILKIEERVLNQKQDTMELSMNEIHAIEMIGIDSGQIMSDIAKKLKITIGSLSIAIDRLVKKGYIQKVKHDTDKRAINICLTEKGELAYKTHEMFHKEMIDAVVAELNIDEFKIVLEFLDRINSFFTAKYNLR